MSKLADYTKKVVQKVKDLFKRLVARFKDAVVDASTPVPVSPAAPVVSPALDIGGALLRPIEDINGRPLPNALRPAELCGTALDLDSILFINTSRGEGCIVRMEWNF